MLRVRDLPCIADHIGFGLSSMSSNSHSVVLFYKYFSPTLYPLLHRYPEYYAPQLLQFQKDLCHRLGLSGRLLLAVEGINGTLSAPSPQALNKYIHALEQFDLAQKFGFPPDEPSDDSPRTHNYRLFSDIDWKRSTASSQPFPDLKVSLVTEIVSTGNAVSVEDVDRYGGRHLEPREFHHLLLQHPDAVVIDVRNTFEYDIGHFVNPNNQKAAVHPAMTTFSMFDSFCAKQVDQLKDRKVLMYCTGGIRCEKASAMLRKRGVEDVSQLKGGIHRYLEEFGEGGFFRGRNFVFDARTAMTPSECKLNDNNAEPTSSTALGDSKENVAIVGRCVNCDCPFDEIAGSRVCTVCRDLVLVCPTCRDTLREYHCRRHAIWKSCYFTFLEVFDVEQLKQQQQELMLLHDVEYSQKNAYRRVRKTISKQIDKITQRVALLESRVEKVEPNAPRRCRTCFDPINVCDGRCWGFWRTQALSERRNDTIAIENVLPIDVGDQVEPGAHWNAARLGTKLDSTGRPLRGVVVEIKGWVVGSTVKDCVVVTWEDEGSDPAQNRQPAIYRWGVVALNGERMYDVRKL